MKAYLLGGPGHSRFYDVSPDTEELKIIVPSEPWLLASGPTAPPPRVTVPFYRYKRCDTVPGTPYLVFSFIGDDQNALP